MSRNGQSLADDLAYCASVTREGGSNLWFVSRLLPEAKKNLFSASYASMRYIDDLVDDGFLQLGSVDRQQQRSDYLTAIDDWEAKSTGQMEPGNSAVDALYRALNTTIGQSDLGPAPWHHLAAAMRRDVNELAIESWEDFDEYSLGATISPSVVYLYILLCRIESSGSIAGPSSDELYEAAGDLAIFCYLVHIMRDLSKDIASGSEQLLTIPSPLREGLRRGTKSGPDLIAEILTKAGQHRHRMMPHADRLAKEMRWPERQAFNALIGIYQKLFNKIRKDPDCVFTDRPQILDQLCRVGENQ